MVSIESTCEADAGFVLQRLMWGRKIVRAHCIALIKFYIMLRDHKCIGLDVFGFEGSALSCSSTAIIQVRPFVSWNTYSARTIVETSTALLG